MQFRWKASFSASCLHAAASMHEGLPIADSGIAQVLQPHVEALVEELNASGFAESALHELTGLAADYENNRQLVEVAGTRMLGAGTLAEDSAARLAGCIAGLESAWLREQPQLVDELAVRGRPLREQWEARGPGLMHTVKKLAGGDFVASAGEVVLVSPIVGGHGRAHLASNRVTFEAVLTNPNPQLSEVVRLGWLLAQLHVDVPRFSESVPRQRLPGLARLATLPLILTAAEVVELATLDEAMLRHALDVWHLANIREDTAEKLLEWWHALQTSETRWPVALAALDQMMSG